MSPELYTACCTILRYLRASKNLTNSNCVKGHSFENNFHFKQKFEWPRGLLNHLYVDGNSVFQYVWVKICTQFSKAGTAKVSTSQRFDVYLWYYLKI